MVACEFQLIASVDVLHEELCAWAVRRASHPQVKILVLACLKVERAIAAAHLADFVDDHGAVLAFELRILGAVRQQLEHVQHEVTEAVRNATRRQHKHALFVAENSSLSLRRAGRTLAALTRRLKLRELPLARRGRATVALPTRLVDLVIRVGTLILVLERLAALILCRRRALRRKLVSVLPLYTCISM